MSVPRVFISSTYYDLKQVRFNIGDFIKNLGYEPVMHERSGVAYTQNEPLEQDCYHELVSCDIVVCIIGNHFGSKSADNEFSITMNEIQTAIKNRRKVYIFIAKDVYIENRTYEHNKENGNFKSAYTDNLKIHEFISELKHNDRVLIESFETTDEIISTLKLQFAGLFQNLLVREASKSESAVIADLSETALEVRDSVHELREEHEAFFKKFESTVFGRNCTLRALEEFLGINKSSIFARNIDALDELMMAFGYSSVPVDNKQEDKRKYTKSKSFLGETYVVIFKKVLFNSDGTFKDIRQNSIIKENLICDTIPADDDQLPF